MSAYVYLAHSPAQHLSCSTPRAQRVRTSAAQHLHLCCSTPAPLLLNTCTSAAQHLHLCCSTPAPLLLNTCTSAAQHLHLCCSTPAPLLLNTCNSAAQHLHLCCSTPATLLLNTCTSAAQHLHLRSSKPHIKPPSSPPPFSTEWNPETTSWQQSQEQPCLTAVQHCGSIKSYQPLYMQQQFLPAEGGPIKKIMIENYFIIPD